MSNSRKFGHRKRTPPRKQIAHSTIVTPAGTTCLVRVFDGMNASGPRRLYMEVGWDGDPSDEDKQFVEIEAKAFLDAITPNNRMIAMTIDDDDKRREMVDDHFRGDLEI